MEKTKKTPSAGADATADELLALSLSEENHSWKHPRYIAADSRLQELRLKLGEIEERIRNENNRITDYRKAARQMAEAHCLVHGTEFIPDAPGDDLKRLYHDHAVHKQAVALAEKHLDQVDGEVSRAICTRLKPAFFRLSVDIYRQLKALEAARKTYMDFLANVESGGTRTGGLDLFAGRTSEEMEDLARAFGISLDD